MRNVARLPRDIRTLHVGRRSYVTSPDEVTLSHARTDCHGVTDCRRALFDPLVNTILIKVKSLVAACFNGARGPAERNDLERGRRVARRYPRRRQLAERFNFAVTRKEQIADELLCRSYQPT